MSDLSKDLLLECYRSAYCEQTAISYGLKLEIERLQKKIESLEMMFVQKSPALSQGLSSEILPGGVNLDTRFAQRNEDKR